MPILEITAGLSAIKTALDILKGAKDLKGSAAGPEIYELHTALIDAQRGLIAADQAHASDVDRIRDLEKEVAGLKEWDTKEKVRYELQDVGDGVPVFALKKECAGTEPAHWLCTRCFGNGQKGFMQSQGNMPPIPLKTFKCSLCDNSFRVPPAVRPHF